MPAVPALLCKESSRPRDQEPLPCLLRPETGRHSCRPADPELHLEMREKAQAEIKEKERLPRPEMGNGAQPEMKEKEMLPGTEHLGNDARQQISHKQGQDEVLQALQPEEHQEQAPAAEKLPEQEPVTTANHKVGQPASMIQQELEQQQQRQTVLLAGVVRQGSRQEASQGKQQPLRCLPLPRRLAPSMIKRMRLAAPEVASQAPSHPQAPPAQQPPTQQPNGPSSPMHANNTLGSCSPSPACSGRGSDSNERLQVTACIGSGKNRKQRAMPKPTCAASSRMKGAECAGHKCAPHQGGVRARGSRRAAATVMEAEVMGVEAGQAAGVRMTDVPGQQVGAARSCAEQHADKSGSGEGVTEMESVVREQPSSNLRNDMHQNAMRQDDSLDMEQPEWLLAGKEAHQPTRQEQQEQQQEQQQDKQQEQQQQPPRPAVRLLLPFSLLCRKRTLAGSGEANQDTRSAPAGSPLAPSTGYTDDRLQGLGGEGAAAGYRVTAVEDANGSVEGEKHALWRSPRAWAVQLPILPDAGHGPRAPGSDGARQHAVMLPPLCKGTKWNGPKRGDPALVVAAKENDRDCPTACAPPCKRARRGSGRNTGTAAATPTGVGGNTCGVHCPEQTLEQQFVHPRTGVCDWYASRTDKRGGTVALQGCVVDVVCNVKGNVQQQAGGRHRQARASAHCTRGSNTVNSTTTTTSGHLKTEGAGPTTAPRPVVPRHHFPSCNFKRTGAKRARQGVAGYRMWDLPFQDIPLGMKVTALPGITNAKVIFVDKNKQQLTSSCHLCQAQHFKAACQTGVIQPGGRKCSNSMCKTCVERHCSLSFQQLAEKCARCRGVCPCRQCLRQEASYVPPTYSPQQQEEYAQHVLRCCGPVLAREWEKDMQEVSLEGVSASSVPVMELEPLERTLCNVCATSICNMFRTCQQCGWDVCLDCCQEQRTSATNPVHTAAAAGQPDLAGVSPPAATHTLPHPMGTQDTPVTQLRCANPGCCGELRLQRMFGDEEMTILQEVVQEYGNAQYRPWQWLSGAGQPVAYCEEQLSGETIVMEAWGGVELPIEDVRAAGMGLDGQLVYIYTPHMSRFAPSNAAASHALLLFQECWRRGEPVVVRGLVGRIRWDPETMARATRELGNKAQCISAAQDPQLDVIVCTKDWAVEATSQVKFFKEYSEAQPQDMKKIKDWPPWENFRDRLKRHNQDFLEQLPLVEYTHPQQGHNRGALLSPLNLATMLPANRNPTDLGPKTYIAFGRQKEDLPGEEGDSVTKLHLDMSDAINIMCHTNYGPGERVVVRCGQAMFDSQADPSYGNASAVWDIYRRDELPGLRAYLQQHVEEFKHHGRQLSPKSVDDVILSQCMMVTQPQRKGLRREQGVVGWHFEQHQGEAVFVPGGCAHQVRNLRASIKAAVDFVSPESVSEALALCRALRAAPRHPEVAEVGERPFAEKLQAKLILYHGVLKTYRRLKEQAWDHGENEDAGMPECGSKQLAGH